MHRIRIFNLPGLDNSGPAHWQSIWEATQPFLPVAAIDRIKRSSWNEPVYETWQRELEESVANDGRKTVIVAHSLGCLSAAGLETTAYPHVKAALLVAPANADRREFPSRVKGFFVPQKPLQIPSILVASEDDPFASLEWSRGLAQALGSRFVSVGPAGHINGESNLGSWTKGQEILRGLLNHVH